MTTILLLVVNRLHHLESELRLLSYKEKEGSYFYVTGPYYKEDQH